MSLVPDSHRDLLERPLFGHLATIRRAGGPQVNPMWFSWDGEYIRFTNTTIRYKYKSGVGLPYALTVTLFGGTAPYLNEYLATHGHADWYRRYVAALCLLGTVSFVRYR
ncbi:pyridoxamine 5'-phosphate oxidase family protein [Streptomyces sp. NPDC002573]|uniref:pyridoxamine 5'-phosphate oxidase family protein n=1 Tax=Streptomyces sp. NPDC002573 TaxID=3364651 RepID=UPI003687761E